METEKDFYQISLKVILKNKQGQVLILKDTENGKFIGRYDFPGGRIDVDEFTSPFEEIIKREMAEEVGNVQYKLYPFPVAIARDGPPIPDDVPEKGDRVLYVIFEADYLEGDIVISQEHTAYKWADLTKEKLEEIFTPEFLQGVIMYLRNRG